MVPGRPKTSGDGEASISTVIHTQTHTTRTPRLACSFSPATLRGLREACVERGAHSPLIADNQMIKSLHVCSQVMTQMATNGQQPPPPRSHCRPFLPSCVASIGRHTHAHSTPARLQLLPRDVARPARSLRRKHAEVVVARRQPVGAHHLCTASQCHYMRVIALCDRILNFVWILNFGADYSYYLG